jgi:ferrous iron transport protein B
MGISIALAGNPNSGKTTLFNALTGSNQFVGNWPGVTVEKKEGQLKGYKDVTLVDLPGIYSLSPYSMEEVVARNYLLNERPDAILNIVDGTNIERNLYLTTQLLELGIPVVVAINMMDIVKKESYKIFSSKIAESFGCEVVKISALKETGIDKAAAKACELAKRRASSPFAHKFSGKLESVLADIEDRLPDLIPPRQRRFYAVKLFERDKQIAEDGKFKLPDVEALIKRAEAEFDDDSESIVTNERYEYITSILESITTKQNTGAMTISDKIDAAVTNRFLALPIFAAIMFAVYFISISSVGAWATDWANDSLFGGGWHLFGIGASEYEAAAETAANADPADYGVWIPGIPDMAQQALSSIGTADWLSSLIIDGIVGGVGAVLGFVPQMFVLFFLLAFLEACGYMARIAFIMDRIFRYFGLSGKSFIPFLIGTGCSVPGIMASRTIENESDRRMTVITTSFMPCSAKMPVIALIAGALFGGAWWVAPSAYFLGVASILMSGIMLKKLRMFRSVPSPFVMELPNYHMPTFVNLLRSMWERGWSFVKKAGTVILISSVAIWFLSSFGIEEGRFAAVTSMGDSFLALIGNAIAWIFTPLGFGDWQSAVAVITGLVAKENIVGTFGVLFGFASVSDSGAEVWGTLSSSFTAASAYSFLMFNLLCAPCFAAVGAIRREMNSGKWTAIAIGYQTGFAYVMSLIFYQVSTFITTGVFGLGTVFAFGAAALVLYMLLRPVNKLSYYS